MSMLKYMVRIMCKDSLGCVYNGGAVYSIKVGWCIMYIYSVCSVHDVRTYTYVILNWNKK